MQCPVGPITLPPGTEDLRSRKLSCKYSDKQPSTSHIQSSMMYVSPHHIPMPALDVMSMEMSPFWIQVPFPEKKMPEWERFRDVTCCSSGQLSRGLLWFTCARCHTNGNFTIFSFPFSWLLPPIPLPVPDVAQMDTFPFCVKLPPLLQRTPECKTPWLVDHSQLLRRGRNSYIRGISTIGTCMLECKRTVHHQWGCDIQPQPARQP